MDGGRSGPWESIPLSSFSGERRNGPSDAKVLFIRGQRKRWFLIFNFCFFQVKQNRFPLQNRGSDSRLQALLENRFTRLALLMISGGIYKSHSLEYVFSITLATVTKASQYDGKQHTQRTK